MNDTVEALILSQQDYKENDVLLHVLTKEYGKITFRAAAARKMTSKNAGAILPYTLSEIHYDHVRGKTMFRMKTAHTKRLYRSLHEDLNASLAAGVLSEAANIFSYTNDDPEVNEEMFDLVSKAYELLDQKKETTLVLSLFLSDLMRLFGIIPEVDGCVICGNTKVSSISVHEGGFLCAEHARERNIPFEQINDLKSFRLVVKAGLQHFEVVEKINGTYLKETEILIHMLKEHAGIELKSFMIYNRLFALA